MPTGFSASWEGGTIVPGTEVEVVISFYMQTPGNHVGNIIISSDAGQYQATASAYFSERSCNVAVSATTIDFGKTLSSFGQQFLDVTNNGNAPVKLSKLFLNWDGLTMDESIGQFTHPDFSVSGSPICLGVGQSTRLSINFTPKGIGPTSTYLSLITDECPSLKNAVLIKGEREQSISRISLDKPSIDFGVFEEAYKEIPLTISNTGNLGFTVSGLTLSNAALASQFSLTPSTFTVNPGQSVETTLRFSPSNFGAVSTNITINSDASHGNKVISFSGNRRSVRRISVTPSELWFSYTGESHNVTIKNLGNDNLSIEGFNPSVINLQGWSVTNFPITSLGIGQTATFTIVRTGSNPTDQNISVIGNQNEGSNLVVAKARTRVIGLTSKNL